MLLELFRRGADGKSGVKIGIFMTKIRERPEIIKKTINPFNALLF